MKKNVVWSKKTLRLLSWMQHLLLILMVISLLIVMTGSKIIIHDFDGETSYNLHTSDQELVYEDSVLFNTILGKQISHIARYVTIRSQLETNGVYDAKKEIDVTAFNLRDRTLPAQYVTANYYLGDLIKWQKFGMEYESIPENKQSSFLNTKTSYTCIDQKAKYTSEQINFYNLDLGKLTFTDDISSNMLSDDYHNLSERKQLMNRYQTIDRKTPQELTSTWEEYDTLCDQIKEAAYCLYSNYEEYLKFQDFYGTDCGNLKYCVLKTIGNREIVYSNVDIETTEQRITEQFRDLGKYIYYSPSELIYKTNTAIEEKTFRTIFSHYSYAYPEEVKIWIGVDCGYAVNDAFTQGKTGFGKYFPYFWQFVVVAICAMVLYVVLLIIQCILQGRQANESGAITYTSTRFDRCKTEWFVLLWAVFLLFCMILLMLLYKIYLKNGEWLYSFWMKTTIAVMVFLCDIAFLQLLYSLVRRWKNRFLWKNSYFKKLLQTGASLLVNLMCYRSVVLKSVVPVAMIAFINIFFTICAVKVLHHRMAIMFLLVCLDAGFCYLLYRQAKTRGEIIDTIYEITAGNFDTRINCETMTGDNKLEAEAVNTIGRSIQIAVEKSMKDERMKADLITNVSHDIKTPLTSIINYIDLIKREDIENTKVQEYIRILDEKSQRLKTLTNDLVEASKVSSGNIVLNYERINLVELINQTIGEFSDKFEEKNLNVVFHNVVDNPYLQADPRRLWRVIENLFNNAYKYALPGTRIYIDLCGTDNHFIMLEIKNVSAQPLNCNPEELTERFIRGDESRTTEGSGLGLSIAKNLTKLQQGKFDIVLDGDLFKVILQFPMAE